MVVYFALDEATGLTKVGTTTCLRARFESLRFAHRQLKLVAFFQGGREAEAAVHAQLWDHHEGREWFRPNERMAEIIARIAAGTFDRLQLPPAKSPLRSEASSRAHAARRQRLSEAA